MIKNQKGEEDIPTHVVAVVGFVQKGNKFLIAKRNSDDPQAGGEWSIPGGKVETGEGASKYILEGTLKKEVEEEVGIQIKDEMELIVNGGFVRVSGHHVVILTFLCKWKSGRAKPLEDQEEVRWVTLTELKKMTDLPDYTRDRVGFLEDYLKRHKELSMK